MRRQIIYFFAVSTFLLFCFLPQAFSQIFQTVQINSSPNPVGSGARAVGMGGAFIAIADDATAASWNPGGLMQLERPEFSFVLSFDNRKKYIDSRSHREMSGTNRVYRDDLNYLSVAYPFRAFNKNMVVSLNYQRLYDFYDEMKFDYNFSSYLTGGGFLNVETRERFSQRGALKAFSPAFAIQITPRLSFGFTLNFWTNKLGFDNEWVVRRRTNANGYINTANRSLQVKGTRIYEEDNKDFEGFNFNLGLLWHVNRVITIGAVFKSPLIADVTRKTYNMSVTYPFGFGAAGPPAEFYDRDRIKIKFPMSYGLGIAFRLSDSLTISTDVYRTQWSDFYVRTKHGSSNPITGTSRREAHVKDTTQVRIGGEYLMIFEKTLVPIRLGFFYDPEPSYKNPDDFFGVSAGTGIMLGNNIALDCAYVYRFGRNVKGDAIGIERTKFDIDQHSVYFSMIFHF